MYQTVDDFIDWGSGKQDPNELYARWVLHHHRLPAFLKASFHDFINHYKLFCVYQGKKYRVTGASRFGDIWLSIDPNRDSGYDLRVGVNECSEWSEE